MRTVGVAVGRTVGESVGAGVALGKGVGDGVELGIEVGMTAGFSDTPGTPAGVSSPAWRQASRSGAMAARPPRKAALRSKSRRLKKRFIAGLSIDSNSRTYKIIRYPVGVVKKESGRFITPHI
jgi:hypothetical protein